VLAALPAFTTPEVLIGASDADDAAVYRIAPDRALVATVDFFTPIVDDAADFGAIAAANSLSDVYAMGGRPLFALSLVGFPRERLDLGLLQEMVRGGAAKMVEAGVPVLGGHSVDDPEPKFGYAVTGEIDPDRVISRRGARAGDLLYLTKPLHSGLVATAIKRGLCPPDLARRAVDLMTHLNRRAGEAMVASGATAATDVTGFGLIGHLASLGVPAEIRFSEIPILDGVAVLAAQDLFPGGSRRNLEAFRSAVDWGALGETERLLLCDAQTSGGLLVALPPDRGADFERDLAGEPYPPRLIGHILDQGQIRVRP
jgi:selenide,water dikinase